MAKLSLGKLFTRVTAPIFNGTMPKYNNAFANAFYQLLGAGFTNYDDKAPTYIDKGYNVNPIVYSIVQAMSTKTASVPFEIKVVKDESKAKSLNTLYPSYNYEKNPGKIVDYIRTKNDAFEERELPMPLKKPNVHQTWSQFFAMCKTFLRTTGNVFIYMVKPSDGKNAGKPIEIYVLPSQLMKIVLKKNAKMLDPLEDPIDYYMLVEGSQFARFDAKDVIHIKLPNPNYDMQGRHLYGLSPLAAALKNIQSSNEALQNNIKTLSNGGVFGIVHADGKNGGGVMEARHALQLKQRLQEMDSDKSRVSNIAAISAPIAFTKLSTTTEELRPFDYLQFDQKQICNVLGWSDKLLNNDEGAKYDNAQIYARQVVTDNIVPDLNLFSDAFNDKFFPLFQGYENAQIFFDVLQLPEMQQDTEKLVGWLNDVLDRGVITRAEYRQSIGYASVDDPEMQVYTVSMNVIPLSEAIAARSFEPIEDPEAEDVERELEEVDTGDDGTAGDKDDSIRTAIEGLINASRE